MYVFKYACNLCNMQLQSFHIFKDKLSNNNNLIYYNLNLSKHKF